MISMENQVYELGRDLNTIAAQSINNRYVVLYQSVNIGYDSVNTQAGQLWMLDTQANESRAIFEIEKNGADPRKL